MTYSKKDTEIILELFNNFISSLSNSDYTNLINGYSEIRVFEKELDKEVNYLEVVAELNNKDSVEGKLDFLKSNMPQKRDLISLARYLDVKFTTKSTINELQNNIIEKSEEIKEEVEYKISQITNEEKEVESLFQKFAETMDSEEAKSMLKNSPLLTTKKDLVKFARKLDVFPDKAASTENIIDTIVKSVVEAKLRSYKIRQKI